MRAKPGYVSCEVCGKCFKSQIHLDNHVKKLHEKSAESHLCGECGKIFNGKRNLVRHIERQHSHKEFVCQDCGAVFKCRKDLIGHVNRERDIQALHSIIEPFRKWKEATIILWHKDPAKGKKCFGCIEPVPYGIRELVKIFHYYEALD